MTKDTSVTNGLVLFAHGSRDPLWHKPISSVAQRIGALSPDLLVTCAYLELSSPDIATATRNLLAAGASNITVVPLFLGVGRHAREDLPLLFKTLVNEHPQVNFTLKPAVGEDPRLIDLLVQIAMEGMKQ